jgi:branched-chain amino acid transport system substrate-binding protein
MFAVSGALHHNFVISTYGDFLKMEGATKIGVVGYPIRGAAATTKDVAVSSQKARLKVGYIDASFPIGSTDVGRQRWR